MESLPMLLLMLRSVKLLVAKSLKAPYLENSCNI